ncbi:MAG: BMC domain-containing protein [candidate division KSB1 bacterium]|nr:BMC domain-containing protein [candidate division KSB1 bacterium]MDZ7346975.1 BMC domain-containing protein [candidate division KSB1 bacterium]MDZ7371037.1 BMC domain-containing protein [candidate division KSB1 bacterium]
MNPEAVGLLELNSIASGLQVTDAMLKSANVELVLARTICSGKYLIIISGSTAAVTASVEAGIDLAEGAVIDSVVVPRIHRDILPAISGITRATEIRSLGIIETFSVGTLLEAADTAAKAANVEILEIRLAMALGGKAFVSLTGDVSAVRAAVEAGAKVAVSKGLLVNQAIIPAPAPGLYRDYI